jgi:hypothetical protein
MHILTSEIPDCICGWLNRKQASAGRRYYLGKRGFRLDRWRASDFYSGNRLSLYGTTARLTAHDCRRIRKALGSGNRMSCDHAACSSLVHTSRYCNLARASERCMRVSTLVTYCCHVDATSVCETKRFSSCRKCDYFEVEHCNARKRLTGTCDSVFQRPQHEAGSIPLEWSTSCVLHWMPKKTCFRWFSSTKFLLAYIAPNRHYHPGNAIYTKRGQ